ncbi:hypothetical protein L208DRAFT_1401862 [Tricholoma matsutake]|nr:hypothetical protein L208DRAFT_1401862 [Tricholoma matsutake 945]
MAKRITMVTWLGVYIPQSYATRHRRIKKSKTGSARMIGLLLTREVLLTIIMSTMFSASTCKLT